MAHMLWPTPPLIFINEKEEAIAAHVETIGTFRFPLMEVHLKMVVKVYLEKCGSTIKKFNSWEWLNQDAF